MWKIIANNNSSKCKNYTKFHSSKYMHDNWKINVFKL